MKKPLKVALYILLALVLIVLAYVIYVFAAYYRVEDWQTLSVVHCDAASAAPMADAPQTGVTYRVSSANVGFGAYSADYSFFMDGGKESRARSRQAQTCSHRARPSTRPPRFLSAGPASRAASMPGSGARPMRMTGTPARRASSQPRASRDRVSGRGQGV